MAESTLGILETSERRDGFLRRRERSYLQAPGDVRVPQTLIQRWGLRMGDEIAGALDGQRGKGGPSLGTVDLVNGQPPSSLSGRPDFSRLPAVHPFERLRLECDALKATPYAAIAHVIDLLCPLGKGQRALIVAPAKAGKTTVLLAVAKGVAVNYPRAMLVMLLTDERPEEVTEMEGAGVGEVVASSFDFPAQRHVAVAEITLERARRRVEAGEDVVLILDSITRLARAYNTVERGDSRTLSGGLGASALERPKRFFGSARAVDPQTGSGSLTIIATALVDTGSKMDQVIFEEFKGTGNSELMLSRALADRRIYPAIDLVASATRREELLFSEAELAASHKLRQQIAALPPEQGMQLLLEMTKDRWR